MRLSLPETQQEHLVEIVQRRLVETRRSELAASVREARADYRMGRKRRHANGRSVALDQVAHVGEGPIGEYTVRSSPDLKGLVAAYQARGAKGPVGAKAAYLLRDTLKIIGAPEAGLLPATAGIFYVNEVEPLGGGTGHTIRVCMERQVPVVFQAVWCMWGFAKH